MRIKYPELTGKVAEAVIASVRAKVNEMMKDYPMFAW